MCWAGCCAAQVLRWQQAVQQQQLLQQLRQQWYCALAVITGTQLIKPKIQI
jgi:hypothetical protein